MNSVRDSSSSAFIAAKSATPGLGTDQLAHMFEVVVVAADDAAQHRIGIAAA